MKEKVNIVWFKRDLRLSDHLPLKSAIVSGLPLVLLCLAEPEAEERGELDSRHRRFVAESVAEMNEKLARFGSRVELLAGRADDVFEALFEAFDVREVFSHRETGIAWTFDRDRRLARFFREHGAVWREFDFSGISRGLRNREGWAARRDRVVAAPNENPDLDALWCVSLNEGLSRRFAFDAPPPSKDFQRGGTSEANRLIEAFLKRGGRGFLSNISKPVASAESCSRLSPYLAWGNVSVRQIWRLTTDAADGNRNLQGFRSRLAWRDHFIQRFEMADSIEFRSLNEHSRELERGTNDELLDAWTRGRTGFPLIDAAMRAVAATGWLNFRLRATVVSFLTHSMWLDWRPAATFLGRMFLDYEPGIHYSQFMMQSGESGFHTIRVYNPIKQSREHDPKGEFLRRWLPELASLPDEFLHEPWKLGGLEAKMLGFEPGVDYPAPVIDFEKAYRHATKRLWEWKSQPEVEKEAKRLADIHRG